MRTAWWLATRLFGSWRNLFNLSTSLSVIGLAIGVSSLILSMAVFSGYVTTLERTVQDAVGHLLILKRGAATQNAILNEIRPYVDGLVAETPFVYAEAILAHKGKINGVLIEGIEESTVHNVLNLRDRVIAGTVSLARQDGEPPKVLIGKGIAEKFNLGPGDDFRVVVPLTPEFQTSGFRPKLGKYRVAGVVNFGRHDFDTRYIVMEIRELQDFVELGRRITGYRMRLDDPFKARAVALNIANRFGVEYWARDWQEVNRNLFEAAKLEKLVLFFVLLILVVAAAFNVANTLFVSVVQRYRDISVLKTLGADDRMIRRLFAAQGLIVGAVGALLGVILGLALCGVFEWVQTRWRIIPKEVYKLDHIELSVQTTDLVIVVGVSLLICFIATLVPSRRGAKITPVEGLRYE